MKAINKFCKKHNITIDQFYGKEKIEGYLYLSSLTSIPEGFNPTVGGNLYLSSLTSIPEGFNPTVGGSLYLRSLTSIPEGFNPTVGGYLDLSSLTSIPEGFNPTVGGSLDLSSLTSIPEGFNPTVGGSLYLSSLTSIPEGFNPTVGGSLYLRSLTSIPEGFNPTVGGYLDLRSGLKANHTTLPKNYVFTWQKGKYIRIDGILNEVLSKKKNILKVRIVGKTKESYIAQKGDLYAHGETVKKAVEDLEFKIISENLKNEPIKADTIINIKYYRLVTGACEQGVKSWMDSNGVKVEELKASELLPLLEKTNAYGLERFKKLITF